METLLDIIRPWENSTPRKWCSWCGDTQVSLSVVKLYHGLTDGSWQRKLQFVWRQASFAQQYQALKALSDAKWCSTWHHQAMRERWNDQFHRMSPGMRDGVIGKFHWMLSDLQKRTEKFHSVSAGPEEWMGWLTAFSRGNDADGVQTGKFHRMSSSSGTQNDKFLRTSWSSEKWIDEFHRTSSGSERWTINFSGRRHALRDGLMSFSGHAIIMLWELGWSVLTGCHQADGWADLIKGNLCEHWALRGGLTSLMEGNSEVSQGPCKLYLMTSTSERWTDHAKAKHVCHDLRQFVKMSLCVRLWIFWGVDQNECHIKNSWTPPCASVKDFAWHPV